MRIPNLFRRISLLGMILWLGGDMAVVQGSDTTTTTAFFFGDVTLSIFDLPRHFQASYHRATGARVNVQRHSPIGATLNTHVEYMRDNAEAPNFADANNYRWMVLQEQGDVPAIPSWRTNSTMAAQTLHDYAEDAKVVRTMFFSTWGRRSGFAGTATTVGRSGSESYPDFATHNEAIFEGYQEYVQATTTSSDPTFLAPVGLVFGTIYYDCVNAGIDPLDPDQCLFSRLYSGESNYPSMEGTYVAGLTIATAMTGYDPMRQIWLPDIDDYDFDPQDAFLIRNAVSRTILDTFRTRLIQYPWTDAWPTDAPTKAPTYYPTISPSYVPSNLPSVSPSDVPSRLPSISPSNLPSTTPSSPPTGLPSNSPSLDPSVSPSRGPSHKPSLIPSIAPTTTPSWQPSEQPSIGPTDKPSASPSLQPTDKPSASPSLQPTATPSIAPSSSPTKLPSNVPTMHPSCLPSMAPTNSPSSSATPEPSVPSEPDRTEELTNEALAGTGLSLENSITSRTNTDVQTHATEEGGVQRLTGASSFLTISTTLALFLSTHLLL